MAEAAPEPNAETPERKALNPAVPGQADEADPDQYLWGV